MAKEKGYRARSAFKLLEIQKKFKILKPGQTVVDLGAAPGSFLQVISDIIGPNGKAIGVDLQAMDPMDLPNVILIQGDIYQADALLDFFAKNGFNEVDVVTSDLAPKTSGIKDLDQGRSMDLTTQAAELALRLLKPGGHFIGKVFENEDLPVLMKSLKRKFNKVQLFKPKATRERSFETYLIALGRKSGKIPA